MKMKNLFVLPALIAGLGVILACAGSTLADVHYVDVNGTNATPPYTNWTTAATNIQHAVDAAVAGDEVVVTNGIYATGGRDGNRVKVDKPLSVRSVNGPQLTTIDGGQSKICVRSTNSVSLSGFTLANGTAGASGGTLNNCTLINNLAGGAYSCTLNNCTLTGNSADFGGGAALCTLNNCTLTGNSAADGYGGGAAYSMLNNCTLTGNSVYNGNGGGAYHCTLNNCTLTGNLASDDTPAEDYGSGGGAYDCTLNNCILTGNSAYDPTMLDSLTFGGGAYKCVLNYCIFCCNHARAYADYGLATTVNHVSITSPGFVDQTAGNLRLGSNSPCINAGNNSYVTNATDLDGNPRISGGTVDIGAYEFQSPVSMISYAWLQQFNLPIDPATDAADPDGDGVSNYREWLDGSDPTNPFSFAPLLTMIPYGANVILTWPTNAFGFTLQCTTNLVPPTFWTTNSPAPVVVNAQNAVTNPIAGAQQFYRLSQ
ncbi:MAG TPA: right-handed parallel beta-helix repeat-containing protein [Verrucomicrobiae bacterium]|nr:right-handed parallel beta-helix repeat-containing protein [Verrucomicrobiae bacterium]